MKSIIFLFLLFAVVPESYSQNCKFTKNEVDEFTGSKIIVTDDQAVHREGSSKTVFSIISINGNYKLKLVYANSLVKSFLVKEGELIMLKLNNGNVIQLEADDYYKSQSMYVEGLNKNIYWAEAKYNINRDQLEAIKNNGIEKVRIYLDDTYYDHSANGKLAAKFINNINCILTVN